MTDGNISSRFLYTKLEQMYAQNHPENPEPADGWDYTWSTLKAGNEEVSTETFLSRFKTAFNLNDEQEAVALEILNVIADGDGKFDGENDLNYISQETYEALAQNDVIQNSEYAIEIEPIENEPDNEVITQALQNEAVVLDNAPAVVENDEVDGENLAGEIEGDTQADVVNEVQDEPTVTPTPKNSSYNTGGEVIYSENGITFRKVVNDDGSVEYWQDVENAGGKATYRINISSDGTTTRTLFNGNGKELDGERPIYDRDIEILNSLGINVKAKETTTTGSGTATGTGGTTGSVESDDGATGSSGDSKSEVSDDDIRSYADMLNDALKGSGTKKDQFNAILLNENLSPSDWVRIINAYNGSYGSLINDVDGDFSYSSGKSTIISIISSKLIEAAQDEINNGTTDGDAIELICKELYNSTDGKLGTSDEFVEAIINSKTPKSVIKAISENYNKFTTSDLLVDLDGDFSSSKYDEFKKIIDSAINSTQDETIEEKAFSELDYADFAAKLNASIAGIGTQVDDFNAILNNPDIKPSDLVQILKIYNEQYGSFIKNVEGDFSGNRQDIIMAQVATALAQAAQEEIDNGIVDGDAIKLICKELYNSTAGTFFGTSEEFVLTIINDSASEDLIKAIAASYSKVNPARSLIKDIKGDFSGKEEKELVRILQR